MLNIVVPMASKSPFFSREEYPFPKPLIEINGIPMIQYVVDHLSKIRRDKRFIFIVNRQDCTLSHLDNTLRLVTEGNCTIIQQEGESAGAPCSVLMAMDQINNDSPLIISNGDQLIQQSIEDVLQRFDQREVDAGVICFDSVHPKWSYVRLDEEGKIVETAEKNPISRNAIAGFYYFRKGSLFVDAAIRSIIRDSNVNGLYYIAPVYNELVLDGRNLEIFQVRSDEYHSFYSPQKIQAFESLKSAP